MKDKDREAYVQDLVSTIQNKEKFNQRVANGESPGKVAKELGITLAQPL